MLFNTKVGCHSPWSVYYCPKHYLYSSNVARSQVLDLFYLEWLTILIKILCLIILLQSVAQIICSAQMDIDLLNLVDSSYY